MNSLVLVCWAGLVLGLAVQSSQAGKTLDDICEKCDYCRSDPGCEGCQQCGQCESRKQKGCRSSQNFLGNLSTHLCRWCRKEESVAQCKKRCSKGCNICSNIISCKNN